MFKKLLITLELEQEEVKLETEDTVLEEDLWLFTAELMSHLSKH